MVIPQGDHVPTFPPALRLQRRRLIGSRGSIGQGYRFRPLRSRTATWSSFGMTMPPVFAEASAGRLARAHGCAQGDSAAGGASGRGAVGRIAHRAKCGGRPLVVAPQNARPVRAVAHGAKALTRHGEWQPARVRMGVCKARDKTTETATTSSRETATTTTNNSVDSPSAYDPGETGRGKIALDTRAVMGVAGTRLEAAFHGITARPSSAGA